jgi:hypothetical protein
MSLRCEKPTANGLCRRKVKHKGAPCGVSHGPAPAGSAGGAGATFGAAAVAEPIAPSEAPPFEVDAESWKARARANLGEGYVIGHARTIETFAKHAMDDRRILLPPRMASRRDVYRLADAAGLVYERDDVDGAPAMRIVDVKDDEATEADFEARKAAEQPAKDRANELKRERRKRERQQRRTPVAEVGPDAHGGTITVSDPCYWQDDAGVDADDVSVTLDVGDQPVRYHALGDPNAPSVVYGIVGDADGGKGVDAIERAPFVPAGQVPVDAGRVAFGPSSGMRDHFGQILDQYDDGDYGPTAPGDGGVFSTSTRSGDGMYPVHALYDDTTGKVKAFRILY